MLNQICIVRSELEQKQLTSKPIKRFHCFNSHHWRNPAIKAHLSFALYKKSPYRHFNFTKAAKNVITYSFSHSFSCILSPCHTLSRQYYYTSAPTNVSSQILIVLHWLISFRTVISSLFTLAFVLQYITANKKKKL